MPEKAGIGYRLNARAPIRFVFQFTAKRETMVKKY
jgi:hypothetical protein